jgi:hypothetical protein
LRGEYKSHVFENRVLEKTYGPKMAEVVGIEDVHNEELTVLLG